MKRLILVLLLTLTLCGCGRAADKPEQTLPDADSSALPPEAEELLGVWVNAGQYEAGKDFVETLTLADDGTAVIHLDYQGRDYATLTGSFTTQAGVLIVHLSEDGTNYDRIYDYTLENGDLILTSESKTVRYSKSVGDISP